MGPIYTRLRYVSSREPEAISDFLQALQRRVQVYGAPVWTGERWVLWFVPADGEADIASVDLE